MFIPRLLEILCSDWLVAVDCFLFTGHCKTQKKKKKKKNEKGSHFASLLIFFLRVYVFYDKLISSLCKKKGKKKS